MDNYPPDKDAKNRARGVSDDEDEDVVAEEARMTALQNVVSSVYPPQDKDEAVSVQKTAAWQGPTTSVGSETPPKPPSRPSQTTTTQTTTTPASAAPPPSLTSSISSSQGHGHGGRKARVMLGASQTMSNKLTPPSRDYVNHIVNDDTNVEEHAKDALGIEEQMLDKDNQTKSLKVAENLAMQELDSSPPPPPELTVQAQHREPGAYRYSPARPPRRADQVNQSIVDRDDASLSSSAESDAPTPTAPPGDRQETLLLQATLVQSERDVDDGALHESPVPPSQAAKAVTSHNIVQAKEVSIEEDGMVGIKRRNLIIGGFLLIVVVACAGIVVGVMFGGGGVGGDSSDLTLVPTPSPTGLGGIGPTSNAPTLAPSTHTPSTQTPSSEITAPPFEDSIISTFVSSLPPQTLAVLQDSSSPQAQALTWLSGNTRLAEYTEERLLQRFVLATLYYSTNGDSWTNNLGWLSNDDECTWNTVNPLNCAAQEMRIIHLSERNLQGTIPWEIGLLTSLIEIDLSLNSLDGLIPSSIGQLQQLEGIFLYFNNLWGTIPTEVGTLENLLYLDLELNALSSPLPSEIQNLVLLDELWLAFNNFLEPVPTWLSELNLLRVLEMDVNEFEGVIPTEMGLMQGAVLIDLSDNYLEGFIPSHLALIPDLQTLHLHNNFLSGSVPPELCDRVTNNGLNLAVDCDFVFCDCNCDCSLSGPLVDDFV